jgi:hypothetical protein
MTKIRAIKGFEANLQCRGFQFQVSQTYRHEGKVKACVGGFHAIPADQHPLSVFIYYPPAGSRFCIVELDGATDRDGDKIAAEILTVGEEIGLGDLAAEAVAWVVARAKPEGETAKKDNGLATASGDRGAANASGDQGAATASGTRGAATASGDQGAATASGNQGAATASGTQGAATASGDQGAATASGNQGAATASGYRGAATASGYRGAATASGDQGAATASGEMSCAMATGPGGMVRGDVDGVDLFAREIVWTGTQYERQSIACGTTGQDGVRAGVWYRCKGGRLVEA